MHSPCTLPYRPRKVYTYKARRASTGRRYYPHYEWCPVPSYNNIYLPIFSVLLAQRRFELCRWMRSSVCVYREFAEAGVWKPLIINPYYLYIYTKVLKPFAKTCINIRFSSACMGSCRVVSAYQTEQGHNGDGLDCTINVHRVDSAVGALDSAENTTVYNSGLSKWIMINRNFSTLCTTHFHDNNLARRANELNFVAINIL